MQDARGYCHVFFPWYNTEQRRRASRGYSTGREDVRRRVARSPPEIYGWFTEGFDTADLCDAQKLLDQLSPSVRVNSASARSLPVSAAACGRGQ